MDLRPRQPAHTVRIGLSDQERAKRDRPAAVIIIDECKPVRYPDLSNSYGLRHMDRVELR